MKYFFLFVFYLTASCVLAQQKYRQLPITLINSILERYTENTEEVIDFTDLQEQLELRAQNPINLNHTNAIELQKIVFLTTGEVDAILQHRKLYGEFLSIFELQAIVGLGAESLKWLPYFVTINTVEKTPLKFSDFKHATNQFIYLTETDLQTRKGYTKEATTPYLGNNYRHLLRYRYNVNNRLYAGFTTEKDMGEPFASNSITAFEFNSTHLFYKGFGNLKTIAIGDFQANFGQGLVMGSGISPRKSALVLNVSRNYEMLRPYRSANQVGFLRGAALTYVFKKLYVTPFVSAKNFSGTVVQDSLQNVTGFTSEAISGLFRTQTELDKRNNNFQTLFGLNATYKLTNANIGFTYVYTNFQYAAIGGTKPYQLYNFNGNNLQNAGLNFQGIVKNVSVFGEVGFSTNHNSFAGITGLALPLSKKLDLLFLYRNYSKAYFTPYTNAFGEFAGTNNEQGFYSALIYKPISKVIISTYLDLYNSKWLRFLVDGPSVGFDFLTDWQYNPNKETQIYCRYRFERKQTNNPIDDNYFLLSQTQRQSFRLHAQQSINKELVFKVRFEKSFYKKSNVPTKNGLLFFADLSNKFSRKIQLSTRIAWFDVDDYNARIYAVENDVLYQYAIPMFYNQGWRYYLVFNYQPTRKIEFWLKYGQTTYSNVNTISSGNEQINGNLLQELRAQVMVWF